MIATAELPLNRRGAVYHLDLCPDEIGDIIITVGDPSRVHEVSQHFDSVEIGRSHREFVTHTGYLNGKRISVVSTGIGVDNIDIVFNELDALANIDLSTRILRDNPKQLTFIRLGTTGALQAETEPGEILITQFAIGFDTLLHYYEPIRSKLLQSITLALATHLKEQSGPFYLTQADEGLLNYFAPLGTIGITATCCGFFGPQGRRLRVPLRYPQLLEKLTTFRFEGLSVTNLEMETSAILGLGNLLGHHCISLSVAVSNRQRKSFVDDVSSAVEGFIEKAMEHIALL